MKRLMFLLPTALLLCAAPAFAQEGQPQGTAKVEAKAEVKKEVKSEAKAEVKKEVKSEAKAEAKAEVKTEPVPANPEYAKSDALLKKGPEALLAAVDKNHHPFKDEIMKTKMVLNGGAHKDNTFVFYTYTKDLDKRAVRFEEPSEMKGMGVVIKGRDEVYARLPDSNKVRRVGTHSKRQSFYGSDWTMDDMSMITLGQDYTPTSVKDEGSHIQMTLKLKPNVDLPYPKLVIKIDKKLLLIDYIEYYDTNIKYVKLQQRMEPKDFNGITMYSHVRVTDVATKHTTDNYVLDEKINQNLGDDTFSKRWLVRSL